MKTTAPRKLALAVDDDRTFLQGMRMMLRVGGFEEVKTAGDVETALAMLEVYPVELIVSDWNMDPLDGLEFLRRVRENPATKDIPFILVTASLSEAAWRGAIELGATDFLVKPFTIEQLHESVDLCLGLAAGQAARSNVIAFPRQRRAG